MPFSRQFFLHIWELRHGLCVGREPRRWFRNQLHILVLKIQNKGEDELGGDALPSSQRGMELAP